MKPEPKKKTEWSEEPLELPTVVRDADEQRWYDEHPPHESTEESWGRTIRHGGGRDKHGRFVRATYHT